MKREDLKAMGLTDEQVDAIMKANGQDINAAKAGYSDYEDIKTQLATANGTITTLKSQVGNAEDLNKTIKAHEATIKNLQKQYGDQVKTQKLKEALTAKGVEDPEYMMYLQGGLDKFVFGEDGAPIGVDDILAPYKESKPHLFKADDSSSGGEPFRLGGPGASGTSGGGNNPTQDAALAEAFGLPSDK